MRVLRLLREVVAWTTTFCSFHPGELIVALGDPTSGRHYWIGGRICWIGWSSDQLVRDGYAEDA